MTCLLFYTNIWIGQDFGSEEEISEEESSESVEEVEEAFTTTSRPASRKRKATGQKSRSGRAVKSRKRGGATSARGGSRQARNVREPAADVPSFENFIYDSILDPEVSINELASEWLDSYDESEVPALKDMVNFILKVRIIMACFRVFFLTFL